MGIYTPSKEEVTLLSNVIAVGEKFKPLHQKLGELFTPEVRNQIAKLKTDVFGVTKGDEGKLVEIAALGKNQCRMWRDFVQVYFGVSARRINQLLDTEDSQAERAAKREANWTPRYAKGDKVEAQRYGQGKWITGTVAGIPDSRRGMYGLEDLSESGISMFHEAEMRPAVDSMTTREALGQIRSAFEKVKATGGNDLNKVKTLDAALTLIEMNPESVDEDEPIERIESVGQNPHYDRKDPYLYFSQFKSEPQTLGDELAAMLIEFRLDLYQIKDVLRYAEKDAKLTLGKTKAVAA